jgi:thiamine phosphate synthase YjbQ (UPF0047 family)
MSEKKKRIVSMFILVCKAQLTDEGKYTCQDRQTNETTDCRVNVTKGLVRLVKGFPETLIVPQGKCVLMSRLETSSFVIVEDSGWTCSDDIRRWFLRLYEINLMCSFDSTKKKDQNRIEM